MGVELRLTKGGRGAWAALLGLSLAVGACTGPSAGPGTTIAPITTTAPESATTTVSELPVFRIGLVSGITTDNWWAALETPDESADRAYLTNMKPSLFTLSQPGFIYIADMAAGNAPVGAVQEGDRWVVQQPIRDDVSWSDGEPVTARDLVFYFNTVREFDLTSTHAGYVPGSVVAVTAPDDFTVRIEFSSEPGLATWQNGVGFAPFVPSHFWEEPVTAARAVAAETAAAVTDEEAVAAVVAASVADATPDNDLAAGDVTQDQINAHKASIGAKAGKTALLGVESPQEPSAGPVIFESWARGEMAVTVANPNYFDRGTEHTLYSDGSYRVSSEARGDQVFGGEGSGDVLAGYVEGPFVSEIVWVEHPGKQQAYQSLAAGEVDFVYDPEGVTTGTREMLSENPDLEYSVNQTDRFRFLAFNLRKAPTGERAFREAVSTVINKEAVAQAVLGGTVFPAYTIVHPDLPMWHNPDVFRPGWRDGEPMTEAERFMSAIDILTAAGYTWERAPVIDPDSEDPVAQPGVGLSMPNGVDVPEISILITSLGHDPYRATFGLWIAQWLNDLGIPATTNPTEFDSVVRTVFNPATFEEAQAWDMYILGWAGANPSLPGQLLVQFFHSRGDPGTTGGLNSTGFSDPDFDAAADAFIAAVTVEEAQKWTLEMERIVQQQLPYLVLFRLPVIEAYQKQVQFPVDTIRGGHSGLPNAWPAAVRISRSR
jgi:ABC-type transport system substrate-binding protein